MSAPKHTPWESAGSGYSRLNGVNVQDRRGLIIGVAIGDVPELEPEKTAALFAAAPDLLSSLQDVTRILTAVRMSAGLGKSQIERLEKAKAAILKASGAPS